MNNIKRKIYVILLATFLVSLGLNSCKNLDFPSPNEPDVNNPPGIQRLVTGAEDEMRNELWIYLRVVETFGRNVYYFETADPRYTGELLQGPIDAGGFLLNRPWDARYRVIKNCSILLDQYADDKGAAGFANTITAYQLLLLLNYMDENGVKIEFSTDINTPFVSKAAAFTEIERRLDVGLDQLNAAGAEFSFALSGGFSGFDTPAGFAKFNRAIKARVLVLQSKYADALTALGSSFVDEAGDMNTGVYHVYSEASGDQSNNMWEDPASTGLKLHAHPSYKTDAEAGDTRYSSKVSELADTASFNNLGSNLAIINLSGQYDKIPLIRNEELVLLRAEANIGLGNNADAAADINAVRAAAGLASVDVAAMSAGDALNQLLHEKRYSLFMEGQRWVDMRHYGKLDDLPKDRQGDIVIDKMPRPETEVAGN